MAKEKNIINSYTTELSVKVLILANLLSVGAAFYFGWDIFTLILLYWVETAIIGLFTIVKMIYTGRFLALFLVPFFCVHFGLFMFVHLTFLQSLFTPTVDSLLYGPITTVSNILTLVLLPALILFVSHLFSFFANFIGKREFYAKGPMAFFAYPYPRIIVMHLTIIAGGFLSVFAPPQVSLALLAVLKTIVDVKSHRRVHSKKDRMWQFKRLR